MYEYPLYSIWQVPFDMLEILNILFIYFHFENWTFYQTTRIQIKSQIK